MLGLRSALLLASACASTLCMAAPTPRSGPSGTTSYAGATIDSSRFPVQVKVPIGEGYLYTFDVINSIAIERPGMYFAPGPTGCFFDKGGQVTTDGNNSLPFGFDLYTKSLRALGVQAPTVSPIERLPCMLGPTDVCSASSPAACPLSCPMSPSSSTLPTTG